MASAIALQSDGKVLLGGLFTNVNNVVRSRLARLNGDGSVDNTFQVAPGANDLVYTLALQADNRIVVGGEFTRASGVVWNTYGDARKKPAASAAATTRPDRQ